MVQGKTKVILQSINIRSGSDRKCKQTTTRGRTSDF